MVYAIYYTFNDTFEIVKSWAECEKKNKGC